MHTRRAIALASLVIAMSAAAGPPASPAPKTAPPPASPPPAPAATTPSTSPSTSPPPEPTGGPCHSLVTVIETLYQKQQFEAADVVLGLALNSPEISTAERVRLYVLEGILRMEAFQDPQATKAFTDALTIDRDAKLPEFAPPRTRRLFEDIRSGLPVVATPPTTTKPPVATTTKKKPDVVTKPGSWDGLYPWIPIGLGAASAVTGGGFLVATYSINGSLRSGSEDIKSNAELRAAVDQGKMFQTTGWILTGVGTAALLGGLAWKFGPDVMPVLSLQVAPAKGGMAVTCSGVLP